MNSCASAARAAASISSRVASGRPKPMLAVIVSEKRNESSNTTPMLRRSESRRTSRTSAPSMVMRPGVHVVEAGQHQRDGRLARARAADERDRLARRDREIEVAEHRLGRRVAERHVLEPHLAVRHHEVDRVGRVLHDRRRVEQVVDALGAGPGELADGEDRGELADRRRDQQHVGGEREERAERDVGRGARASRRARAPRPGRTRGSSASRAGAGPGCSRGGPATRTCSRDRSVSRSSSRCSCPKPFTTRTPVTSSSTTLATSPAFCCASQLAGNTDVRSFIAVKSSSGRDREHDERQQRRQPEHRAERHDEQQDVRDADRQELQEALERARRRTTRGSRAGRSAARRGCAKSRRWSWREDRGAQVVLHVERDAPAAEAAEVGEDERRTTPITIISVSHGASGLPGDALAVVVCGVITSSIDDLLHERAAATG